MPIPESLKCLFWDLDPERLDPEKDRDTIVSRVAEYGTDQAVRWLRKTYTNQAIEEALVKSRHLVSRRTMNLWRLWLGKKEDWCAKTPSRPLKGAFWKS